MKFTADKNTLFNIVSNASKACASKSSIPALEGVLLNLEGNKLTVTGYDLEMGIRTFAQVSGEQDGEIVLTAKVFTEMIRKMPSSQINIDATDGTNVIITSGNVVMKTLGISGENYPNIPALNEQVNIKLKEKLLKNMISQTIFCVSQNMAKPVNTGSKFEVKDNVLNVVSVDNVRMARRTEKTSNNDIGFVVPFKTLSELQRITSEESDKEVTVFIDRNQICFSKDDYMIISRLLEGEFIDYNKVMNFSAPIEAVVNVRELYDSLDRSLLLVNEKFKMPVVCVFENDTVEVSCKTNIGEMADKIPCKFSESKLEIAFNARFMMDALKFSECDEVKLQFISASSPIKIIPVGEENFTFLVMPVRQQKK